MPTKILKSLICLSLFISSLASAWQPQSLVVFGDSLSDNGNKYQAYQIPVSPPYWNGRYSNGPVWAENLAYQLNLIPNPLVEPNYPRDLGLRDYAIGDSTVLEKNLSANSQTRSLMQELKEFQSEPHSNPANTLVIIWDGANDFKSAPCQASPFTCTKDVIHTQVKLINTLYEFGLRHFLILSLPSLSITPIAHEAYSKEQRAILRGTIKYYNNNLALAISQLQLSKADIDIHEFDTNEFIRESEAHFNQPIYQECYVNHSIYTKAVAKPCPIEQQNHYFFWDALHPSAAAHALLANKIYDAIN